MKPDRGSVTIWMLGLVLVVMAVGGLSLDLWRVLAEKHRLELLADAAAAAGAGSLDEVTYRATGEVTLDGEDARARAASVIAASEPVDTALIGIAAAQITVSLTSEVELSLLRILLPEERPIVVSGSAVGTPSLFP